MRKIENLVFEGGGVLGMAYSGAIQELEKNQLLEGVKRVAGTSVGSVAAALVSLRYTATEIDSVLRSTNFKDFEDHPNPLRVVTHYGIYKGEFLLNWLQGIVEKKTGNKNSTFADLHAQGFRELHVFACDLNTGSVREFSYEKTPDACVAYSMRASMSIPLFFEAWSFPDEIPNKHIYVDGGTMYNYPITAFDDVENTLGFFFRSKDASEPDDFHYNHIFQYVSKVFNALLDAQKPALYRDPQQMDVTVFIDPMGISATDFSLTDEQKDQLFNSGQKATAKYLKQEVPTYNS